MRCFLGLVITASAVTAAAIPAAAIPSFSKQAVFPEVFQDAALAQEPNGQYWTFGSNNGVYNVPLAQSLDFATWKLQSFDALPHAGAWTAANPTVLAPYVRLMGNGQYVMYYSAALATNANIHCIGAATSNDIKGPYQPNSEPLICPKDVGGAGGPSIFQDPVDDRVYIIYKENGNSLVKGGPCGNQSPTQPAAPTPIMIQLVNGTDGQTLYGAPTILLEPEAVDGPAIGAPSMAANYDPQSPCGYTYFLFYSSGCYTTNEYATRYATQREGAGVGFYNRAAKPLMSSGDGKGLWSPGSLDISADAQHVLFSSYERANAQGRRQLRTGLVKIQGLIATI